VSLIPVPLQRVGEEVSEERDALTIATMPAQIASGCTAYAAFIPLPPH
jgi:hypothetical protein